MNPQIISEKPLTMADVKEQLKVIKKRDGELSFRANKTEEAINEILKIDKKTADSLTKKLTEMEVPRMKELHIAKIVDILPKTIEELKVVLQGYTITVNNDNMKKIVEAVKEVIPKKK